MFRFNVDVPEIVYGEAVPIVVFAICGEPVVEYNGWAIAPAGAPAGNCGPDAVQVSVPASTDADVRY
ncbi:MAG: hypothetical protein R2713_14055 [Ilumatobacteraceae bacterium]|nr:hypothetical protein [Acidimicrobiaceae bacterium]MCB9395311.1 hypothetical protein [Acidimicrobiaceae bacterium]